MSQPRSWLPRAAPMHLMLGAMLLILIQSLAAVEWQRAQPFFALPLELRQGQLWLQLPAQAKPITVAAIELQGHRLELRGADRAPDPDYFASYAELNAFLARQQQLHHLLEPAPSVTLIAGDDTRNAFARQPRTLLQIPLEFWLYQAFGALALLVGVAFWAFHRSQPATRILALAGLGFALMEWTMALYASRELALAESIFRHLLALNHLGGMLFAAGTIGLLMFQPVSQPVARPIPWLLWAGGIGLLLCWGNEILQWVEWPGHIFYFPCLLLLPVFVALVARQWRLCRSQPRLRAQLNWLMATLLTGLGLTFALYVLPLLLEQPSWLSLLQANIVVLLVFLGFVLGAQRSELFGIHRWWLRSWIVSGALLILVLADVSALLSFHQAGRELGLLTFVISWLYLPLRQWCWQRALNHCKPGTQPQQAGLQALLDHFKPLHLQTSAHSPSHLESQRGLVLAFPLDGDQWCILTGKQRGFSLFTAQDAADAHALLTASHAADHLLQQERDRIMRDLHDDVAADLLTLLHQAEDDSRRTLVQETLGNLRAIIYSLQPGQSRSLAELVLRWQADCRRRCSAAGVNLHWHCAAECSDLIFTPAQSLHLQRLLREAVSNALRHAHPRTLSITLECDSHYLQLRVTDDGHHSPVADWRAGKGLHNLQLRARELHGTLQWRLHPAGDLQLCELNARFPLRIFAMTPSPHAARPRHADHLAA